MKGKRIAKTLLIVVLAAALLAGGTFGAIKLAGRSSAEVNVYPVGSFSVSADWITGAETDGIVSADRIQSIYLSSTQQITEIYVEEGQTIHVGDPILSFDTTLSDLELERQGIRVEQLKLDIQNAEAELQEIGTYRIGSPSTYTPTYTGGTSSYDSAPFMPYDRAPEAVGTYSDPLIWLWNDDCIMNEAFFLRIAALAAANREAAREKDGSEEPEPPAETEIPEEPDSTLPPVETEEPEETAMPVETARPVEPEETETPEETEAPAEPEATAYPEPPAQEPEAEETESAAAMTDPARLLSAISGHVRLFAADTPVEEELPDELDDPNIYIVFEVRSDDAPEGDIERVWEMVLTVDADTGDWYARMITPSYDPGDNSEPDYSYDDYVIDTNVYYTAAEIAQMKAECSEKLRDLRLDLRAAELEYDRLSYELSGGEVYSKIDGVVKTVRDPDEALSENRPLVLVSGGGGYFVTAALGELDLGTMQIGDTVTVMSWENYQQLEGVITDISEYPDESNQYWFYSEGNQNVSVYPFKVFIDEDANLREGEYVSVTYNAGTGGGGLYLENPFIRQENGKSYVYTVGDDGLLEKRYVRTGQNLWGSYTEILGGLAADDYVAFPYGRQTQDGARVRFAEADELWSSMYY